MSSDTLPLITIIVAVYNGAKTLQKCIDSIVSQTYPHKQLIIIDGSSTDGTVDILKANNEHISYWVSEQDTGIYNAWNKGLAHAKGEWVSFLGADDFFWDESVLSRVADVLISIPAKYSVVYGNVVITNDANDSLFRVGQSWEKAKKIMNELMSIPHPGAMHHKRLFDGAVFDESFKIAGDYEFLLRELKDSDAYYMENIVLAGMQIGGVSAKSTNIISALVEVRKAQKKNGIKKIPWRWYWAIVKAKLRILLFCILGEVLGRHVMDKIRNFSGKPSVWKHNK
jgi:glycosyltransferase involved in cell wall biosynthesis